MNIYHVLFDMKAGISFPGLYELSDWWSWSRGYVWFYLGFLGFYLIFYEHLFFCDIKIQCSKIFFYMCFYNRLKLTWCYACNSTPLLDQALWDLGTGLWEVGQSLACDKRWMCYTSVKCWDSNSIGGEGGCQGRIRVNSNGFRWCRARGASTLDLVVTEFRMGCGQMDLASACVLRPLNCLVLYFKMGGMTGWMSGGPGYTGPELAEGVTVRGGVEQVILNGK